MADGDKLDAFLYFSTPGIAGSLDANGQVTRIAKKIDGETGDIAERESPGGWGKSMAIRSYTLGFAAHEEGKEETKRDDGVSGTFEPTVDNVQITKWVDAASPFLLAAVWYKFKYDAAYIVQKKAGGKAGRSGDYFWELCLEQVCPQRLNWNADASGELTETLTLSFKKIWASYKRQKHDGQLEPNFLESGPLELKGSTKDSDVSSANDAEFKKKINEIAAKVGVKPLK